MDGRTDAFLISNPRWQSMQRGKNERFFTLDLKLLNVVSGVTHKDITCDECNEEPVRGIRWKCAVCDNYDLCHKCYMSNEHSVAHEFIRLDVPISKGYKLTCVFILGDIGRCPVYVQ